MFDAIVDSFWVPVDWTAYYLDQFSKITGVSWGPTPLPRGGWVCSMWRTTIRHAVEYIWILVICYFVMWRYTWGYFHWVRLRQNTARAPQRTLDYVVGGLHIVLMCTQWLFVLIRGDILDSFNYAAEVELWALTPCHVLSMLWAYLFICCPKSANYLGSLALSYYLVPVVAYVLPNIKVPNRLCSPLDSSDGFLVSDYEKSVHFVYHALLCVTPLYFMSRFRPLPISWVFFVHSILFATHLNYLLYHASLYVMGPTFSVEQQLVHCFYSLSSEILPTNNEHYRPVIVLGFVASVVFFRCSFELVHRVWNPAHHYTLEVRKDGKVVPIAVRRRKKE